MLLTNHAQKLYRGIEALGGGVIREQVLRAKAGGISHGTFIAARQELCTAPCKAALSPPPTRPRRGSC